MDTSEIYTSGILNKGEYEKDLIKGKLKNFPTGLLVITNKRVLYLTKPKGLLSKGFQVFFALNLNELLSVTTHGILRKWINLKSCEFGQVSNCCIG